MENQGLMDISDWWVISDGSYTDSRDDKGIALTSLTNNPAATELASEISDSSSPVMVLVATGEFEMGADAGVVSGEIQK
jgi:hypothetical protein